jgi:hypothetical protein
MAQHICIKEEQQAMEKQLIEERVSKTNTSE